MDKLFEGFEWAMEVVVPKLIPALMTILLINHYSRELLWQPLLILWFISLSFLFIKKENA